MRSRRKPNNYKASRASLWMVAFLAFFGYLAVEPSFGSQSPDNANILEPTISQDLAGDQFRRAINSSVRIWVKRAKTAPAPKSPPRRRFRLFRQMVENSIADTWVRGSGTVIAKSDTELTILTNAHVVGKTGEFEAIYAELFNDGFSRGLFKVKIKLVHLIDYDEDICICTVDMTDKLKDQAFTPIAKTSDPKAGDKVFSCGAGSGHWPHGQLGHIDYTSDKHIYYLPRRYGGDSGSAVYSADGSEVIGLHAWSYFPANVTYGMAMNAKTIRSVIYPDEAEQLPLLPPLEEINQIIADTEQILKKARILRKKIPGGDDAEDVEGSESDVMDRPRLFPRAEGDMPVIKKAWSLLKFAFRWGGLIAVWLAPVFLAKWTIFWPITLAIKIVSWLVEKYKEAVAQWKSGKSENKDDLPK